MDLHAHRLANRLLGNAESAAALEVTGAGCELVFVRAIRFALAGADLDAALDGLPLAATAVAWARPGARLQFRQRRRGARASLALAGGLDVPPLLGSAATDLGAGLGGLGGRPLRAGQRIAARHLAISGDRASAPPGAAELERYLAPLRSIYQDQPLVLRLVLEDDPAVPPLARQRLDGGRFQLSNRSGRTGYRFEGDPLPVRPDPERLSEPTAPGAVQLPPDGLPILLMADRNSIGGYPRLGHLCSADRTRAAQLWPADEVEFRSIALAEAIHVTRQTEATFQAILAALPLSM
jgi:biotin-dependent carboxylase-like uncharacterized protein